MDPAALTTEDARDLAHFFEFAKEVPPCGKWVDDFADAAISRLNDAEFSGMI